jgi:hypothetical protein
MVTLPDPEAELTRTRTRPEDHPDDTPLETESVTTLPIAEAPANHPKTATAPIAKKPAGKKGAKKADKVSGAEHNGELNWEDFGAEEQQPAPSEANPPKSRKRQIAIIGGSVAAAIVVTCILAFSGGEKPQLPTTPPTAESTPEPPPPPPKKVEPPKKIVPPPIEVAPYPRSAENPARYASAQLLAERASNPAFDEENRGRLFFLRGIYGRTANGAIYLTDSLDDKQGIACFPPRTSRKPSTDPPPETEWLQVGQPVLVRGWYAGELKFTDCRVVESSLVADDEYRDKPIELVGIVGTANPVDPGNQDRFPSIVLEPHATDCPVSVRCLFRISERGKLTTIKPGQVVTIRGRCGGRSFRMVQVHDCSLVPNTDLPAPGVARVPAGRLFAAYEGDLLYYTRPNPTVPPIPITAAQLAAAFTADRQKANAAYQFKTVSITGVVIDRHPGTITPGRVAPGTVNPGTINPGTVVLETGTSHKYKVQARFTPSRFAAVKDHPSLTITGTCVGVVGKFVVVESGQAADSEAGNGAIRITPDYFPMQSGKEMVYDLLTPTSTRTNPIARISVRFVDNELVRVTPLRSGTFTKGTLFAEPPGVARWTSTRPKSASRLSEVRVNEDMVEIRDKPTPPAQPALWWDPILKLGARKGETWNTTMLDGRVVTYTVVRFGKDDAGRNTVEIQRITKHPKDSANWEEATIIYARGIGEVSRVIVKQSTNGKAYSLGEMKWVESETSVAPDPKKEPELKTEPTPPPTGKPEDKKDANDKSDKSDKKGEK